MKRLAFFLVVMFTFKAQASVQCFKMLPSSQKVTGHSTEAFYLAWPADGKGGLGFIGLERAGGERVFGEAQCAGGSPSKCTFGEDGAHGVVMFEGARAKILMNGVLQVQADDEGFSVTSHPVNERHEYEFQSTASANCEKFHALPDSGPQRDVSGGD